MYNNYVHNVEIWQQQNKKVYDENKLKCENKHMKKVNKLDKDWISKDTGMRYKIYEELADRIKHACSIDGTNILQYNFLQHDISITLSQYRDKSMPFKTLNSNERKEWNKAHKKLKGLSTQIKIDRKKLEK